MTFDSLYIAYWSLMDPLCQSQSLPIVRALATHGWRMALMTFEQPQWRLDAVTRATRRAELAAAGVSWIPMRYHRRPSVLSTIVDIAMGTLRGLTLGGRAGIRLLHGRASVPVAIAYAATRGRRSLFLADLDGPLSEEYVDAGRWRRGSLVHRLTRCIEERALRSADARIVLTEHRRRALAAAGHSVAAVVPCAVDTELFCPTPGSGRMQRERLGLQGTVFVYAGKAGGWYLTDAMLDYVASATPILGETSLLVLTTDPPAAFSLPAAARGLRCVVRRASRQEMPEYLAAADAALSFVLPAPSKAACSPVKNAEYLACGLPVVSTRGIGDYSDLIAARRVGVVVPELNGESYQRSAAELGSLLRDPGLRARCREVAEAELSLARVAIPRYRDVYQRLLGSPERGIA